MSSLGPPISLRLSSVEKQHELERAAAASGLPFRAFLREKIEAPPGGCGQQCAPQLRELAQGVAALHKRLDEADAGSATPPEPPKPTATAATGAPADADAALMEAILILKELAGQAALSATNEIARRGLPPFSAPAVLYLVRAIAPPEKIRVVTQELERRRVKPWGAR